jgi:hypothetical protein
VRGSKERDRVTKEKDRDRDIGVERDKKIKRDRVKKEIE